MSPSKKETAAKNAALDALREAVQAEIDQARRDVKEIESTISHSQAEVARLTQRNATATVQIQQMQPQIANMSGADVRTVYDTALDAQQRMFVMRGQIEKLQADKARLGKMLVGLERLLSMVDSLPAGGEATATATEKVEMIIQAQEAERQRLAHDLHDGPTQTLSNFILQTDIAMRLFDIDQVRAREELSSLTTTARTSLQRVRQFIFELRPMMLDDLGLIPTLTRYVESFKEQNNVEARLNYSGMDKRLESYIEVMIFRALQELLSSAVKSQATQIKVQIDYANGEARIHLDDNGRGFDPNNVADGPGMGLKILHERVDMLGGELEVDSVIGQGTRITFAIPARQVDDGK